MTTTTISSDLAEYGIACPLFCGGQSTLTMGGYDDPVTVHPCDSCKAQGGTSWEVTVGQAEHYLPVREAVAYRHADGLVTLR